ncbi:MAG: hydroxymethylglutaryl-CoA synthase [Candidatus Peregrinibacteria bacterium]|nr:hydroxymethylglutaryl-CoA synthase [Candidatus Peregrinibacteria bacterium]
MKSAILGFGRYLPRFRLRTSAIAEHWQQDSAALASSLGITEKTVPDRDEDSFTMAFEAGKQAIEGAGIRPSQISAIFVGSESHPYAVKPTSGMLASALELDPFSHCADLEFACKAGTAGMQIVDAFIRAGQIEYGIAIGTDTAQAKPGDALEYSAAAGAAAIVLGSEKAKGALARIERTLSFTTDTPDFWRAADERFPQHAGRFTGEPGYFHHVRTAIRGMLDTAKLEVKDIAHVVLHMPNAKFPTAIMKEFGFTKEQCALGFIVPKVGNTYSACSLLGLTSVLEEAKKGETVLLVSYGSGAGADAFLLTMLQSGSPLPPDERELTYVSYAQYLDHCHLTPR